MATTNHHSKESGSLVTFIIVGIVLLGLTVGGIFLAKQRGETILANNDPGASEQAESNDNPQQAPAENEQENAEQQPEAQPAEEGATNDEPVEAPADESTTGDNPDQNDENQSAAGANTEQNNGGTTPQPEVVVAPRTGGQAAQIPATGLEDHLLSSALAFTALTYGGIRYAQSRRRLSQL